MHFPTSSHLKLGMNIIVKKAKGLLDSKTVTKKVVIFSETFSGYSYIWIMSCSLVTYLVQTDCGNDRDVVMICVMLNCLSLFALCAEWDGCPFSSLTLARHVLVCTEMFRGQMFLLRPQVCIARRTKTSQSPHLAKKVQLYSSYLR